MVFALAVFVIAKLVGVGKTAKFCLRILKFVFHHVIKEGLLILKVKFVNVNLGGQEIIATKSYVKKIAVLMAGEMIYHN